MIGAKGKEMQWTGRQESGKIGLISQTKGIALSCGLCLTSKRDYILYCREYIDNNVKREWICENPEAEMTERMKLRDF